MSNAAITWCSNLHPGKGPKGVLFCLADRATDHSGEDWTCFPSIADIMKWTDYSRAAVERNLQLLWREGIISRQRRRRADGQLGIYDYTLHREPEHRAALKVSRAAVQDIDAAMENGVEGEGEPGLILQHGPDGVLQHGPPLILDGAMRQNEVQPCGKMRGQEPLRGTLKREPSPGARDLAALFGELEAALPARVLKFTDRDRAFQAFADAAALGVEVEQLAGCARRMAADPEFRSRKHPPPLETWIAKGQWRGWAAEDGAVAAGGAAGPADGQGVPPEIVARFLAVAEAGKVASYLRPCAFEPGPPGRLLARTSMALAWLRGQRALVDELGLVVEFRGRA